VNTLLSLLFAVITAFNTSIENCTFDVKKALYEADNNTKTPIVIDISDGVEDNSFLLLAKCIEAEAGNQGLKGKRLVADVILNRADSDIFPNDITAVITQKNQFSSYTDGGIDKAQPTLETYLAINMELSERLDKNILYFTAGSYNQYCTPAYIYGNHYFGY